MKKYVYMLSLLLIWVCLWNVSASPALSDADLAQLKKNMDQYTTAQIEYLKSALRIPDDIIITGINTEKSYYWEGADLCVRPISLYSNSELLARADVDVDTLEPATSLWSYDESRVDQDAVAKYSNGMTVWADSEVEKIKDVTFLINRPYSEAQKYFPDLTLDKDQPTYSDAVRYSNQYLAFDVKDGFISRIIIKGTDCPYTLHGFKPGDPWEAPREKEFEGGGSSEYFDKYNNILVMYNSLDPTDPSIELQSNYLR